MASKATILIAMIALAVAVAKPVSENASGLIPNDDRLSPDDMEDSPHAVAVHPRDEDNEVDEDNEGDEDNEVGGEDGGLLDDELGDGEAMDGEETVVFRPLFVHRQRQARRKQRRLEQQQRWNSYYGTRYGRPLPRVYY